MRNLSIFSALGCLALVGMVSCTGEEDLNLNQNPQNTEGAMLFRSILPNQTRDGETDEDPSNPGSALPGLETQHKDFGVFAIKADDEDGVKATVINNKQAANLVMYNYLVGHNPEYTALAGQNLYGSNWFYENLGNADNISEKAELPNQFLKYWDASANYTYFFAYSPYITGARYATIDAANEAISLPVTISPASTTAFLAGGTRSLNSNFASANPDPSTVAIAFKYLNSQIKVQVYEAVPGYKVYMDAVQFNGEANATAGIVALPLTENTNGTFDYTTAADYVYSGEPVITFFTPATAGDSDKYVDLETSVGYNNVVRDDERFEFSTAVADLTNLSDNLYIPDISENKKAASATTFNVLPNTGNILTAGVSTENCALQFVLSFTLVAEDTGEVIHVRGARVNVAKDYTQWAPNTVYTYTFKITEGTSGTTAATDPKPQPEEPGKALYPIIFDNITISPLNTSDWGNEWVVNPGEDPGTPLPDPGENPGEVPEEPIP